VRTVTLCLVSHKCNCSHACSYNHMILIDTNVTGHMGVNGVRRLPSTFAELLYICPDHNQAKIYI